MVQPTHRSAADQTVEKRIPAGIYTPAAAPDTGGAACALFRTGRVPARPTFL